MHKRMIAAVMVALAPGLAMAQTGMSGTSGTTGQPTPSGVGISSGTMAPMAPRGTRILPLPGQQPGTIGGTTLPGTVTTGTGVSDGINGGAGTPGTGPATPGGTTSGTTTDPQGVPSR